VANERSGLVAWVGAAVLAVLSLVVPSGAGGAEGTWIASPAGSRLTVHVLKRGLLSGLAHDHHFVAADWSASARFDPSGDGPAHLEVVVRAASLQDQQPALSPEDRAKVDRQAARILDAERFPEIRFASDRPPRLPPGDRAELDLVGTLTLHGTGRPLTIRVEVLRDGEGWRVHGAVRLRQSDFGVEPYSGFLGTIAVQDEIEVEFVLALRPGD
jgi:polyisoprenoid-binding protein YceI